MKICHFVFSRLAVGAMGVMGVMATPLIVALYPHTGYAAGYAAPPPLPITAVPSSAVPFATTDPFQGDARLHRTVKVTAEGVPVGDLLKRLSDQCGITLSARRDVTDEKIILLGPSRKLREILADIALLLNEHWLVVKGKDGNPQYTLSKSIRARQYEAKLLRRADTGQAMERLGILVQALGESPEQLQKDTRPGVRFLLSEPDSRFSVSLYGVLSENQRSALFDNGLLDIPVAQVEGPIKKDLQAIFSRKLDKSRKASTRSTISTLTDEDFSTGNLRFSFVQGGVTFGSEENQNHQDHSLLQVHVAGLSLATIVLVNAPEDWLLPPQGNPYTGEKVPPGDVASLQAAVSAAMTASNASDGSSVTSTAQSESATSKWIQQLRRLAEETGQPIVADLYRSKPLRVVNESDPGDPAVSGLDRMDRFCRSPGYLWWKRGNTLLLRKRDWYLQSQYELPDAWRNQMAQQLAAHGGVPTLDDVLLLQALTPRQVIGLENLVTGRYSVRTGSSAILNLIKIAAAAPRSRRGSSLPVGKAPRWKEDSTPSLVTFSAMNEAQRNLLQSFTEQRFSRTSPSQILGFYLDAFRIPGDAIGSLEAQLPESEDFVRVALRWGFGSSGGGSSVGTASGIGGGARIFPLPTVGTPTAEDTVKIEEE